MINLNKLKLTSKTIRGLSIDAINAANSGHPGLPLGCADIISVLFSSHLNYNPEHPTWINRDKFILSAGHGSMLQYAILHLAGYDITLDQIKNFRQLHSVTAGHPEHDPNIGIETTTGPLGQGIGHSVGLAIADKMLAARLNTKNETIIDNKIYCLVGDGCLMEGISSEVSSTAGHLSLDNLVVIYDSNDICLDGPTSECFTEDTALRYKSYGWDVQTIDGHNYESIHNALTQAKSNTKPSLIIAKTTIGYGSPNRQNSAESHGKPLGTEETNLTKEQLNIPQEPLFHIPEEVKTFFKDQINKQEEKQKKWNETFKQWKQNNPDKYTLWEQIKTQDTTNIDNILNSTTTKPNIATRASSQTIIQDLAKAYPFIIGGSADLSCSDSTYIKTSSFIKKNDFNHQNIKYGAKEFAMATIATGLSLSSYFQPFIGTFLTFSDYMKNGIRLAALMKLPVIYQFTHDSIFLGEDGPTHQPIEHLASLRSMPGLTVIRPADATEVKGAWAVAIKSKKPTALILSRQGLPDLTTTHIKNTQKGAYLVHRTKLKNHIQLLATGSEVALAIDVASLLEQQDIGCNVISFPSWELFEEQSNEYKQSILDPSIKTGVIEAQSSFGWHKYSSKDGLFFTVEDFGLSGKASDLAQHFGFTPEHIAKSIRDSFK